jgi:cell division protein FtsB
MREFQDRRRVRRLLHSRYAIGVLFVILILSADALWGIYNKYQKSEELERRMQGNLVELQSRKRKLEALNASLATEQGKEREIRDRFGVVKEGESTVIIFDDGRGTPPPPPAPARGWFSWLFDLFR